MTDLNPRAASARLSLALTRLDVVQPPELREPVADILRAGVELCAISPSLLGRPIEHALRLATAINAAAS